MNRGAGIPDKALCPDCGAPVNERTGMCLRCLMAKAIDLAAPEAAPDKSDAPDDLPASATRLGDYDLLEVLGRGGMGVIRRARQRSLNREVALKLMPPAALSSPEALTRFRAEAWAAARLDHPGIVPVHEVGEAGGQPFIAMKLAEGGSLADQLGDGTRPPRESAALVGRVARAVQHAHERGVLHRDLKPANILFDARGEPMVADFGLARLLDDDTGLTRSGTVMGSPGYLSPEQARGESESVTVATDVWGLGAVFYALLTGCPPFHGSSAIETVRAVVEKDPVPPSQLHPGLPRDLEIICLRALEKSPSRRYPSAAALADDLDRWLAGRPIEARAAGRMERAGKWVRRHPAWSALTGLSLIAALTIIVQSTRHAAAMKRQRDEAVISDSLAQQSAAAARLSAAAAEAARHRALDQAFAADMASAAAALESGQPSHAKRLLDAWTRAPDGVDRRGFAWRWLRQRAAGDPADIISGSPIPVSALAFLPNGSQLMVLRQNGSAELREYPGGKVVREFPPPPDHGPLPPSPDTGPGPRSQVVVAPDGRWIAWFDVKRGTLTVYDRQSDHSTVWKMAVAGLAAGVSDAGIPQIHLIERDELSGTARLTTVGFDGTEWTETSSWEAGGHVNAFEPGCTRLLSVPADRRQSVELWDLTARRRLRGIAMGGLTLHTALAASGRIGAVSVQTSTGPTVRLIDLDDARLLAEWTDHHAPVVGLVFSPDGKTLASISADFTAHLYDVETRASLGPRRGHEESLHAAAFSPDGSVLATGARDGEIRLWPVHPAAPPESPPTAALGGLILVSDDEKRIAGIMKPSAAPNTGVAESPTEFGQLAIVANQPGAAPLSLPVKNPRPLAFHGNELLTWHRADERRGSFLTWWQADTGERVRAIRIGMPNLDGLLATLSTDRRLFAAARPGGTVALYDLTIPKQIASRSFGNTDDARPASGPAAGLAFSPDGNRLAVTGVPKGTAQILSCPTLEPIVTLTDWKGPRPCLAWSPDGTLLATSAERHEIQLWDAGTGRPRLTFTGHTGLVERLAFSPDGTTLASVAFDGCAKLWHVPTGREIGNVARQCDQTTLQFTRGGQALITRRLDGLLRSAAAPHD